MTRLRHTMIGLAATGALVAGGVFVTPAANAAEASRVETDVMREATSLTPTQIEQAITEARAVGAVTSTVATPDGSVTTIDLGDGFVFDLVTAPTTQRIGAGRDSKGTFVSFNATDQNMIISGSAFALGAAVCAVSGGTFCVVVGAILTAATVAITGSGAIRCGTKQLRVYPFAGGKVKPRCA
ncbi:hypothetical protein [Curtobacterium sp. NPDC086286]|uniref:hypothetical protein n=1 Tax=Curtobacterium sp. NPDC086286 TaxID=3363964 RepID=UPI003810E379